MLDKLKHIDPNMLVLIGGGVLAFLILLTHIIQEYRKSSKKTKENKNISVQHTTQELQVQTSKFSEIRHGFLENLKKNKVSLVFGFGILTGIGMLTIPNMYKIYKAKKEVIEVLKSKKMDFYCDNVKPVFIQDVVYRSNIKNDTGAYIKFKCLKNGKVIGDGEVEYHDNRLHEGLSITVY